MYIKDPGKEASFAINENEDSDGLCIEQEKIERWPTLNYVNSPQQPVLPLT